MLSIILSACVLAAVTLAVHAGGIAVLLRRLMRLHLHALPPTRVWPITVILLRMIWWLILLHLVEIAVWGLFYLWRGCLPHAEAAFYFSGATYTTIGYGDVVLTKTVAGARTDRGLDRHPHVRLVHGLLLRCLELHPSIAQSRDVKATAVPT